MTAKSVLNEQNWGWEILLLLWYWDRHAGRLLHSIHALSSSSIMPVHVSVASAMPSLTAAEEAPAPPAAEEPPAEDAAPADEAPGV